MALLVDATGEYLSRSTGGFYSTATYTVCLWAILDSSRASVSAAIWGLYGPVTNDVYCPILYNQNDDGTTMIWQQNVTGTNTIDLAAGVMTVGTWYFLAHTRSGTGTNSANAYTAAATDTSFTTTTATFSLAAMTPILEVAYTNNFGLTTGWINGRIAGLKQWDAVLTPEELWAERSPFGTCSRAKSRLLVSDAWGCDRVCCRLQREWAELYGYRVADRGGWAARAMDAPYTDLYDASDYRAAASCDDAARRLKEMNTRYV
jgi:hypothetical protein